MISRVAAIAGISKSRAYDEYVRVLDSIVENNPKERERIVKWLGIKGSVFR